MDSFYWWILQWGWVVDDGWWLGWCLGQLFQQSKPISMNRGYRVWLTWISIRKVQETSNKFEKVSDDWYGDIDEWRVEERVCRKDGVGGGEARLLRCRTSSSSSLSQWNLSHPALPPSKGLSDKSSHLSCIWSQLSVIPCKVLDSALLVSRNGFTFGVLEAGPSAIFSIEFGRRLNICPPPRSMNNTGHCRFPRPIPIIMWVFGK